MSRKNQVRTGGAHVKPTQPVAGVMAAQSLHGWKVYMGAVFLMAYVLAVTFVPVLGTLDTNASRFLVLSAVNLVAFLTFFSARRYFGEFVSGFFSHWTGRIYFLLVLLALFSFSQAINVSEALVSWCKMFTGFTTAVVVCLAIGGNRRVVELFAIGMSLLLLYDSYGVFESILKYINASESSIYGIKSVYGNKNIYSAAILVKIPFALWLFTFRKDVAKWLGLVAVFSGMLAILFLSARASYLGIIGLVFAYLFFQGLMVVQQRSRARLVVMGVFVVSVVSVFGLFTFVQSQLYPQDERKHQGDMYTAPVTERLATITASNPSDRLYIWKNTLKLIGEDPLLGVGIGNWKVAVLKYENMTSPDFVYKYKVHNDFLETVAETGVVGGVLYALLYGIVFLIFLKRVLRRQMEDESGPLLFLAAFGLAAYFFDAFFNFPHDRPEMLMFLSIYLAIAIAGSDHHNERPGPSLVQRLSGLTHHPFFNPVMLVVLLVGGAVSVYVLEMNFRSARAQSVVYQLYKSEKLTMPADALIASFPAIPEITVLGEPVNSNKAFVLIHERRFDEAVAVLRKEHSSPYDGRKEHFTAMAFYRREMFDSALVYSRKAYALKPMLLPNVGVMCTSLQRTGQFDEAMEVVGAYLKREKSQGKAWLLAAEISWNAKKFKETVEIIDSAALYLPGDQDIRKAQLFYTSRYGFSQHEALFNKAVGLMDKKEFQGALVVLDEFVKLVPNYSQAWERRAFCHYSLKNYRAVITNVNQAIRLDRENYSLLNLRGVGYHVLNQRDSACADFKRAMDKGRADAADNYRKFCGGKKASGPKTELLPPGQLK